MERQTQVAGVRKWYGDAWIKLQNQIYKGIEDGILGDLPNMVLGGCEVTPNGGNFDVADGIVLLNGVLHIFEAVENTALPLYLTSNTTTVDKAYSDTLVKPVETHYKCQSSTVNPGGSLIEVTEDDTARLIKPYFDDGGLLTGLPKSDALNLDNTNVLATARAVKLLNDAHTTLNAQVATIQTKINKLGSGYFKFTDNTATLQYNDPEPITWTINKSSATQMLNGGILRIDVIQGSFANDGLVVGWGVGNGNDVQLVNGRNILQNTTGNTIFPVFKHLHDQNQKEIEVIQLA